MISIFETGNVYDLRGLSTDEKPKLKWINNGSTFTEIDTSDVYFFNGETLKWEKKGE